MLQTGIDHPSLAAESADGRDNQMPFMVNFGIPEDTVAEQEEEGAAALWSEAEPSCFLWTLAGSKQTL